ncbi:MAG: hypothetical protein IJM30_03765 [Thermoguttaceae bacterium]|nr:hypothetical protein [Thermoguttaceae bacterium]
MSKSKQNGNVVEITGNPGEEVVLTRGGASLVVKIGSDDLFPDFLAALVEAIERFPFAVATAAERVFHNERNARENLRETLAEIRDALFEERGAKRETSEGGSEPLESAPTASSE